MPDGFKTKVMKILSPPKSIQFLSKRPLPAVCLSAIIIDLSGKSERCDLAYLFVESTFSSLIIFMFSLIQFYCKPKIKNLRFFKKCFIIIITRGE